MRLENGANLWTSFWLCLCLALANTLAFGVSSGLDLAVRFGIVLIAIGTPVTLLCVALKYTEAFTPARKAIYAICGALALADLAFLAGLVPKDGIVVGVQTLSAVIAQAIANFFAWAWPVLLPVLIATIAISTIAIFIWIARHSTAKSLPRWGIAVVYIISIFAVTMFVRFWGILVGIFDGPEMAGVFVDYVAPVAGLAALVYTLLKVKKKRIRSLLWLAAVVGAYTYMLTLHCVYPVERLHLVQYSLLAWILYRALRIDLENRAAILCAAALTFIVGTADEGLQFFSVWLHDGAGDSPGALKRVLLAVINRRSGDVEDLITNYVAGGLGLIGLLAVLDGGYWNWHKQRRLGTRFCLGYAVPMLFIALSSHQVWTRYIDPPVNLILLTVDCCRPDRMSAYGYEREPLDKPTTPYLDKLMPDAVRFNTAYSQACWTAPGIVSTLTGLYPPAHGVDRAGNTVPASVETLLDGFRERGYRVPNLAYLTEDPTFQQLGSIERLVSNRDERGLLSNWIGANFKKPFAVWYHYRDLHLPYNPDPPHLLYPPATADAQFPEKISKLVQKEVIIPQNLVSFNEKDKPWLDALWDAEVHQFDSWLEGLRYRLRLHHILDNTLIIITADHGEELLEHGELGHGSTLVHSKHYEELLRIPLIFYGPGIIDLGDIPTPRVEKGPQPARVVNNTIAQQVDILPTVYDLMGWEIPENVQGRSLLPAMQGEQMEPVPVFASSIEGGYQSQPGMADTWVHSVREKNWKLILREENGERITELYDLDQDPGETRNLARGNQTRKIESMTEKLDLWLAQSYAIHENFVAKDEVLRAEADQGGQIDPSLLSVPTFVYPDDGAQIPYDLHNGQVIIRWTGHPQATYILECDYGEGLRRGFQSIEVHGTEQAFEPLPSRVWDEVCQFNPFRVRVRPKALPDAWSTWGEATLVPTQ